MGPIAILGAGLTGLTAANRLLRQGREPVVFEAAGRPGGVIRSLNEGGYLVEEGPNSLQLSTSAQEEVLHWAGLKNRILDAAPEAVRRYLVRNGRVLPLPSTVTGFLSTPLFSIGAKLGLVRELVAPRNSRSADESLADFVRRRLGSEILDYAINPFVGGVYAGDPERLSVRYAFPKLHALEQRHRSLIFGSLRLRRERRRTGAQYTTRSISFPKGLEELPLALAATLGERLRTDQRVTGIRREAANGRWRIQVEGDREHPTPFDAVISTLPPDPLSRLAIDGAAPLRSLAEIPHPPLVSAAMGFRREHIGHLLDGFGFLAPQKEPFSILGALFSSSMFPGRAPGDHALLTVFAGGTRRPDLTELDDPQLWGIILTDLRKLLGVHGEPTYRRMTRWSRAIPQYNVGHGRFVQAIRDIESVHPGFLIGGTACDGISLAYCLEAGSRLADRVTET